MTALFAAAVVVMSALPAEASSSWEMVERWAGHQVVLGLQDLTLVGEVETRTESFVIADVRRRGDDYRLTQYTCRVAISPVAGVQAELTDAAVRALPPATIEFRRENGEPVAPVAWTTVWDDSDHDQDGNAGVTVSVDAPLCGGSIYISTVTDTNARLLPYSSGIEGAVDVQVSQKILGTSNWCLDVATGDSVEKVQGRVRYAPIDASATCDQLFRSGWPVFVPDELLTTASN
ncbi:MAG: hypothetical protein AAFX94_06320 [Myxococcota bacterium]